jgi:2,4-dienoyl-CoA reductase-like NADH-dependent reductase (Old Yellow Enzyme family)
MELENLFSPAKIGNVQIKNRIVRSATHERSSEKYGYVGDAHLKIYTDLAEGGVGLIITGFTAVDPGGQGSPFQVGIFDDSFSAGQKKLVKAVHDYSDVKIATQLGHTGRLGKHVKYPPVAPSSIYAKSTDLTPRELKVDEIKELINKFIEAGCRAYECGYDMVQLHGAHGYFLSNFVSPFTNKRKDEFGGSAEINLKSL